MTGLSKLEPNAFFEIESLVVLKPPDLPLDSVLYFFGGGRVDMRKSHGILEHRQNELLRRVSGDHLAAKPLLNQRRQPPDMVDMGMGQKKILNRRRRYRPLTEGDDRITSLRQSAIDQNIDSSDLQ